MAGTMIGSRKRYPEGRPLTLRRHAQILSTGAALPEDVVTNGDLIEELGLITTDRAVQYAIGIRERRRMAPGSDPSFYLTRAAERCIERAGIGPDKLDRIIYTKLFGDHLVPATSLRVLKRLGIERGIPVMDISAACSGVIHALELALFFLNAGDNYILVLGGDRTTLSKRLAITKDTRTVFLNGDGFGAVLIGPSPSPKFHARYFYTDSDLADFATIPFGTELTQKTKAYGEDMFALNVPDGRAVHQSVLDSCRIISERLLTQADMTMSDIDFLITSDQTHLVWQDQLELLGVPESKSVSCFHKYGNTVAAMVPLNLHEAITSGALKRGMTVMMMGHGAGAAGGGFIFTY